MCPSEIGLWLSEGSRFNPLLSGMEWLTHSTMYSLGDSRTDWVSYTSKGETVVLGLVILPQVRH